MKENDKTTLALVATSLKEVCTKNNFRVNTKIFVDHKTVECTIYSDYNAIKVKFVIHGKEVMAIVLDGGDYDIKPIVNRSPVKITTEFVNRVKELDNNAKEEYSKTVREYSEASNVSESMDSEEYIANAEEAVNYLNQEFKSVFGPGFTCNATISTNFGTALNVYIANVPKTASNLDQMNASMRLVLMLHLCDNFGRNTPIDKFEMELVSMGYKARDKGLKYRKLIGKSPMEIAKKLMVWIHKNDEIIFADYK